MNDGNIVIGTSVDVGGINTGLYKINNSMKKISNMTKGLISVSAFITLGKSALTAASNLQEVQNIVDSTFKDMSYKIEDFSKTCIENFGISELAAKQTAGSFMAMGSSIGFTQDEASDMAVQLTGLTGDFSSFYNISQDYARVALSAVYTGETETLKRYGIILTEANLQQYAYTQGINESVHAMSAKEKALLRYNYIMQATTYVEGDFIRTQNTWANQVRVLQQVWNQFLIAMGNGLITVLTPVVKTLNLMVVGLTRFAENVETILSNIFGIQFQKVNQTASNSISDVADAADTAADSQDNLADSTSNATKAAKKALATWDELNVLQSDTDTDSSSTPSTSADTSGDTSGTTTEAVATGKGALETIKNSLPDTLFGLGRYISDTISKELESIDWDSVYETARNFGTGLAQFLNGLITPRLFYDVGLTIANSLNTVLYSALDFGKTFDWANLGLSIASGINGFFQNFDFSSLAQTLNVWASGVWTAVTTAIENIDWKSVWNGAKEFLSTLDLKTVNIIIGIILLKKIGKFLFFGGLSDYIAASLLVPFVAGFNKAFAEAAGLISVQELAASLGTNLVILISNLGSNLSFAFRYILVTLNGFFTQTLPTFITTNIPMIFHGIKGGIETAIYDLKLGETLYNALYAGFGKTALLVSGIVSIIAGLGLVIYNLVEQWKNGFNLIQAILVVLGTTLVGIGLFLLGLVSWPAIIVAAIIGAVIEIVIIIRDNWATISAGILAVVGWIYNNLILPIANFFIGLWEGIKTVWDTVSGWFKEHIIDPLIAIFSPALDVIGKLFLGVWIIIKAIFIIAVPFIAGFISGFVESFINFCETVAGLFNKLWEGIKFIWNTVSGWFKEYIIDPLVLVFTFFYNIVHFLFKDLWDKIAGIWAVVVAWFKLNIIDPLVDKFTKFKETVEFIWFHIVYSAKEIFGPIVAFFKDKIIDPVVTHFNNFKKDVVQVFTTLVDAVKKVWETLGTFISILFGGIVNSVIAMFNGIIGGVEGAINFIVDAINGVLSFFNSVVSAAAKITGDKWEGVTEVKKVSFNRIPYLAQGAVIPPNSPFMAMLGDQTSGTNIEAPLDTIIEAIKQAFPQNSTTTSSSNTPVYLQIDGKTFAKLFLPYNLDELKRRGYNVNVLEG